MPCKSGGLYHAYQPVIMWTDLPTTTIKARGFLSVYLSWKVVDYVKGFSLWCKFCDNYL